METTAPPVLLTSFWTWQIGFWLLVLEFRDLAVVNLAATAKALIATS